MFPPVLVQTFAWFYSLSGLAEDTYGARACGLWKISSSGQIGTPRESGAQRFGQGSWRLSDLTIDAMGTAHSINGFDRYRDAGFFVCASEFVKLVLKEIGSSDDFAKMCLKYVKTQCG